MEYGIELISQHCQFMLGICELDIKKEKRIPSGKINPLLGELLSEESGIPTVTRPYFILCYIKLLM